MLVPIPTEIEAKGLRWLLEHRHQWNLSMDDVAALLGVTSVRTVNDWQRRIELGSEFTLPVDVVERLSLLLGIHKALVILTPINRQALAWKWFQTPTELFELKGRSIRDCLLTASNIEIYYFIRDKLKEARD